MPLVRGEKEETREEVFAEVNYHAAYEPMRCVRTRRWKYIRRWTPGRPILPNCDASPSKTCWLDAGWAAQEPPEEALYDVIFDPNEQNNRVGSPAAQDALTDMRQRLDRWMHETDDPLLTGHVPAPEGSKVDPQDALDPT